MFHLKTRKQKKAEKKKAFDQAVRKGLLFWLPGGSSRLDVYVDYCIIHCLGKTRMKEKSRIIPFNEITKVVYTPATSARMATLQLFTKDMPDVQRKFWYAYENNMVVVHQSNEDLAQKILAYIRNPYGSNVIPPEYLNELRKERKKELREEAEKNKAAKQDEEAGNAAEKADEAEPAPEDKEQEEA